MVLLFGFGVLFTDTDFRFEGFSYVEALGFSGYLVIIAESDDLGTL